MTTVLNRLWNPLNTGNNQWRHGSSKSDRCIFKKISTKQLKIGGRWDSVKSPHTTQEYTIYPLCSGRYFLPCPLYPSVWDPKAVWEAIQTSLTGLGAWIVPPVGVTGVSRWEQRWKARRTEESEALVRSEWMSELSMPRNRFTVDVFDGLIH
jgi:hypothetical protein